MLTTADLVVLSLIEERPMHGYDLLATYQRQEVEDWTSVSKAQVYYALKKLEAAGHLSGDTDGADARGRTVYVVTRDGKSALRDGLARTSWAAARIAQPFMTWVGLSTHARPAEARKILLARETFLIHEIERERASLLYIATLDTPRANKGAAIVRLVIAQLEAELCWLRAELLTH